MGSSHSGARATHFQNTNEPPPEPTEEDPDDVSETHHISISNKMVERLVEDATLAGGAATAAAAAAALTQPPRDHQRDKALMEKLKHLDDTHSERTGLTIEDVKATARRIDLRTAYRSQSEPVCQDKAQKIIDCYNATSRPEEMARCWDHVSNFSKCVQETSVARLRARTAMDARDAARRTRHTAYAREHALKDLGPRPRVTTS